METRIYTVTGPDQQSVLIEATSQSQAISYVARGKYSARIARPKVVADIMKAGGTIAKATWEKQTTEQTAQ